MVFRLRNLERGLDKGREKSKMTKPDMGRTNVGREACSLAIPALSNRNKNVSFEIAFNRGVG